MFTNLDFDFQKQVNLAFFLFSAHFNSVLTADTSAAVTLSDILLLYFFAFVIAADITFCHVFYNSFLFSKFLNGFCLIIISNITECFEC